MNTTRIIATIATTTALPAVAIALAGAASAAPGSIVSAQGSVRSSDVASPHQFRLDKATWRTLGPTNHAASCDNTLLNGPGGGGFHGYSGQGNGFICLPTIG